MAYRILIPSHIERKIVAYPPSLKSKIREGLDVLAENPFLGKALRDELLGLYSYRVGRYRIVYEIVGHQIAVQVIEIGHRENIYSSINPK